MGHAGEYGHITDEYGHRTCGGNSFQRVIKL